MPVCSGPSPAVVSGHTVLYQRWRRKPNLVLVGMDAEEVR